VTRYTVRLDSPNQHLVGVEVEMAAAGAWTELEMASWTPGSYLMREFSRNVQEVTAQDAEGNPLPLEKIAKNRWRVGGEEGAPLHLRYLVYAGELTVRTSHFDSTHATLNGASTFLYAPHLRQEPVELRIEAPDGWMASTALEVGDGPLTFRAASYDELVDSPIEVGTHELLEFEAEGRPHSFAIWGRGNVPRERLVEDTRRIIAAGAEMFGGLPYARYLFLLHLVPGAYGGLEHRDSTHLIADRWTFRGRDYEKFLGLVAHEFFHLWNGKRIRPAALGEPDLTRETYTRELWVVEGLTTYYTDLLLRRAGLISPERYLERLGESITRFRSLPGRSVQALEESSFDTWIKFYRPDPNTPNAQVSYYQKGALLGLMLDLRIRGESGGEASLDDVMRTLWERYGRRDVGFPEGTVQALVEEVAGESVGSLLAAVLQGTGELPLEEALRAAGVALEMGPRESGERGLLVSAVESRLGVRTRDDGAGRLLVTHVLHGTPAGEAGVEAGDELVALNGFRCRPVEINLRLEELPEDSMVQLDVFRRDELVRLKLRLVGETVAVARLRRSPRAREEARAVFEAWIGEGSAVSGARGTSAGGRAP
jgi:predicted metalloprotease with PDZ domain